MIVRKLHHCKYLLILLIATITVTLSPALVSAQEDNTVYLPIVVSGSASPSDDTSPDEPLDHDEHSDDDSNGGETEDADLLAISMRQLPKPAALATPISQEASQTPPNNDNDGDGVPNPADSCPFQPNPPSDGVQPAFCGKALHARIDNLVFLTSRIFPPTAGLDPNLEQSQQRPRIHALLHLQPRDNGIVITKAERASLAEKGITLLDYLPHNTFYVSVPRDRELLNTIVNEGSSGERIYGISALQPKDKVAPELRVSGPMMGRNADGTLSLLVDFFDDVPVENIEAMLIQVALKHEYLYDKTYRVTVAKWQDVQRLAMQDIVYWIDDLPDAVFDRTQDGQALIGGQTVSNTLGYRGNGIVVSMTESGLAEPDNHPNMLGRITFGNNPIWEPGHGSVDHPQMTSAIMIADETTFPERAGFLPEAELISYSTIGLTIRAQHYKVNKEAREDFGALLSNNSWGPSNCNKIGEYRKRGKYFDRAVYDLGITVVYAAGNTRGPDGVFADEGCESDLYSLPHPVAKNDISVGNWSVNTETIAATSSAGPAADGRLKPDLVAPGQGIDTIGWNESTLQTEAIEGGGTSAAAPATSGVIGWLAESFMNQGETILDMPPARFKAILTHTAKDVGPSGPDFVHGYGLIQADSALRIAEEWAQWGHEATLDENNTSVTILFDVNTPMTFYKATLAWDDEEGKESSTMMLKNDLDLTLISPSGQIYYPYNLIPPANLTVDTPTVPCTLVTCQDRYNNVEMVRANPTSGDFIEQGQWQAVVDVHRLVSDEQSFTLVLSPETPLVIEGGAAGPDNTITLAANYTNSPNSLAPTGVLIEDDDVVFDCDGYAIRGVEPGINDYDGTYAGIRILGDNVTVRNCTIQRFDVGIQVGSAEISPTNVLLQDNTLFNNGTVAIELHGTNHTAERNSISQMIGSRGKGIVVHGDAITLRDNGFGTARTGGTLNDTIGILVKPGAEIGVIQENGFSGGWWYGIRLRSQQADRPVRGFLIDNNEFEGIEGIPIELYGNVRAAIVSRNQIVAYGASSPAIHVTANELYRPKNNLISANIIAGFDHQQQRGIDLWNAENTQVTLNALGTVVTGIFDDTGRNNRITYNLINPVEPEDNYRTAIGIEATRSFTATTIAHNLVKFAATGIVVDDPVNASSVTDNNIDVLYSGILVRNAWAPNVSGNSVTAALTAITLADAPSAAVSNNGISNPAASQYFNGVVIRNSDSAAVSANTIISPSIGVKITGTVGISVTGNTIENPGNSGILLNEDTGGMVDGNTITANSTVGIHYKQGIDALIAENTVDSTASGIGIELGIGPVTCPIRVDNIVVQDNILNGSLLDINVQCDVGTHTLSGNQ